MERKKRIRFKDYQEYLQSDEWAQVKQEWHDNNADHVTCRITMTDLDDEPMVLHHWRYPKDWNDDSHENLILINCKVHEWLHNNFHDDHLGWADDVVMYLANVNLHWNEEIFMEALDDRKLQRASLESKIDKIKKDLDNKVSELEDMTLLKKYYKSMYKDSEDNPETEYKSKY